MFVHLITWHEVILTFSFITKEILLQHANIALQITTNDDKMQNEIKRGLPQKQKKIYIVIIKHEKLLAKQIKHI